jgi:hypothetical protein
MAAPFGFSLSIDLAARCPPTCPYFQRIETEIKFREKKKSTSIEREKKKMLRYPQSPETGHCRKGGFVIGAGQAIAFVGHP